jgi:hypothetical protein
MKRNVLLLIGLSVLLPFSAGAQQGGTLTPNTVPSQDDTNAGGPVGAQAIERPTQAIPNDVGRDGVNCRQMPGTTAQRPATSGASDPRQPQEKCEQK